MRINEVKKTKNCIKVLIVEDYDAMVAGIISIGERIKRLNFIGICKTKTEVMEFLAKYKPDVIIMDISLGKDNGFDITEKVLNIYPKIKIIIYTIHNSFEYIQRAMIVGATGYFTKNSDIKYFLQSLINLEEGKFIYSKDIETLLKDKTLDIINGKSFLLNNTDTQIIIKICEGKKLYTIGEELCLSERTISRRRKEILKKLNLKSDAELIKYAIREKLISICH